MADDEPEYTIESWWPIRRAFLELWPGIDSERVHMALRTASDLGTPGVQELLSRAIELGGPQAADLLMAPVAATFPLPDSRDRADTMMALATLIRAGGDPTPALPALAQALSDRHCRSAAVTTLRRAALAGWPLDPIHPTLQALDDPRGELATVRRLAFLEHPRREHAIAALKQVHANQPVGNLRTGIGLVEQLLASSESQALADAVLAELLAAGRDAYKTWFALLPALRHVLAEGPDDQRVRALNTLSQFRFVPGYALELDEEPARVAALPTLERCLLDIAPHLAAPAARVAIAAAEAVQVLTRAGASLDGVRAQVDVALDHAQVSVRSACSIALSQYLRRTGDEPELGEGASYRRTYSRSDEPVTDGDPRVCGLCGAQQVRIIYSEDDGAQFYRLYTSESHCGACGRYFPELFRASG